MIIASCHCGAVHLEADHLPESVTECTCSICRRYGAMWAYYTRATARVIKGRNQLAGYRWDDKTIEFCHCPECGCLTHYESVEKSDTGRIAINSRMMEPETIAGVRRRKFDGADTWQYLDE